MKILVTGSLGTVGQLLVDELRKNNHEVIGIDKFHSEKHNYERVDISEFRQLQSLMQKHSFDFIYNCAAEFGRWNGEDFYENLWETNVIGLKHLLKLQQEYKFKLIHFSSSEIYGDWDLEMTEEVPDQNSIKQLNDYALSKWCNEVQINNSINMFGTQTVIVRLFNTFGPGERYHPYRSAICKMTWQALNNQKITLYKGHLRSNTYILDCVRTLSNLVSNFIPGRIYNIGNNDLQPMEKVLELILKYTNSDSVVEYLDSEPFTTHQKIVNNNKALAELNHQDNTDLETGIENTVNWMKNEYQL